MLLWQGNSEQKWRLGQRTKGRPPEEASELSLDFVWLGNDDIRRIGSCSHYAKLVVRGTEDELDRLGPILVDCLNANRLRNQLPRPEPKRDPIRKLTPSEQYAMCMTSFGFFCDRLIVSGDEDDRVSATQCLSDAIGFANIGWQSLDESQSR